MAFHTAGSPVKTCPPGPAPTSQPAFSPGSSSSSTAAISYAYPTPGSMPIPAGHSQSCTSLAETPRTRSRRTILPTRSHSFLATRSVASSFRLRDGSPSSPRSCLAGSAPSARMAPEPGLRRPSLSPRLTSSLSKPTTESRPKPPPPETQLSRPPRPFPSISRPPTQRRTANFTNASQTPVSTTLLISQAMAPKSCATCSSAPYLHMLTRTSGSFLLPSSLALCGIS